MLKSLTLVATALAMTASGLAAAPAAAQRYDDPRYGQGYDQGYQGGGDPYRQVYQDERGYPDQRGYRGERRRYDDQRRYDERRRYDQRRCRSGDTGTILGAIAGGLLGNSIAGRGDRALGTVLGAGGGALAGHAIERDGCR